MRQVLQNLLTGETQLADVPLPAVRSSHVLIQTAASLISPGTERMLLEFGKANWLDKARQQPERVRAVLDKIRTDGLFAAADAVRSKLDQPLALGYCNVGRVLAVGEGVTEFEVGDRVVSNGQHAEAVVVGKNLCAKVPAAVDDQSAVFAVPAAIGLEGLRLAEPGLGECFVVVGLGLIGLVTVQLLRANGCRVLGVDPVEPRLRLARQFGAETVEASPLEDLLAAAERFSRGRGVDGVIITAATDSNEPVRAAARICRKRGRIVLVGVAGLDLPRREFYEKELSFQVSCAYGPGRYDPAYEQKGIDYPVGYVRWTLQRNLEAVMDLMAAGRLDVRSLISHRFPFRDALAAYDLLLGDRASLGIVLQYPTAVDVRRTVSLREESTSPAGAPTRAFESVGVSVIGAGNYASRALIPAFRRSAAELRVIASAGGVNAVHAGRKYGFRSATTEIGDVFGDSGTEAVVIATRHDSHPTLVCEALHAGKHVFVEKPLAITYDGLRDIELAYQEARARATDRGSAPTVMVGFNRRFAPLIREMQARLSERQEPKVVVITVNAGYVPADHWVHDPVAGGGRIIGEACHFVDLVRHLVGQPITGVDVSGVVVADAHGRDDIVSFSIRCADGSHGVIHYLANGHRSFSKERIEVFCAGRILQLDNFRLLRAYGWPGFRKARSWRQDKGQLACASAFLAGVRSGVAPIPMAELLEVSRATIEVAEKIRSARA